MTPAVTDVRDWYGPDYLLRRLAALHHDSHAQWLAEELERADVTAYAARWLNLLWYDPSAEPRPASDLPTMRHFEDMGTVKAAAESSHGIRMRAVMTQPAIWRSVR